MNRFPRGQLHETDEGEVALAVGIDADCVVIVFPKPVAWFGLPVEQARELAQIILKRADEAEKNRQ